MFEIIEEGEEAWREKQRKGHSPHVRFQRETFDVEEQEERVN